MKNKRKIIAISGARSEYDLLFSVYEKLNNDSEIDFSIIITGPNLSDTFGYTAQNIINDGFKISGTVYNLIDSNQKIGRIASIGNQITSLSNLLFFEKPDIVIVAGDREEAISVTLICSYLDIVCAHFFGGDIAKDGNVDNSIRYASSKLAHIHFTTLEQHSSNLIRMGEDDWRIYTVGNPALDRMVATPSISKVQLLQNLHVENKKIDKYCVLIQHSIITEIDKQADHIKITLEAILNSDYHCFVNYPNSDAGFNEIIKAYQDFSTKYPEKFTLFKNLNRLNYINLLRNAEFLLGNSSSGILEVSSLGLPAINIGERQRGRIHGDNVKFVDNDLNQISEAINFVTNNEDFIKKIKLKKNPYGNGDSAIKVYNTLKSIEIDDSLKHKNITY